jgi:hypothetical protein
LNVVLLLIVLVAAGLWYGRHLHARLAHALVGGSVTLLALLRLAYDYLKWGADDQIKNLSKRWLGRVASTWVLAALLGVAFLLMAATSSLHLELDPGQRQTEGYIVEVRGPGSRLLWRSPRLAADRTAASRLFFFRFGALSEISLIPAGDVGPIRARLGPGSSIRLQVPSQFQPREFEVVRLLPAGRLLAVLGTPGEPVNQRLDLLVVGRGRTNRVTDLRRQAVYLGSSSNDISLALSRETDVVRRERFKAYATRVLSARDEALSGDLVRRWESLPRAVVPNDLPPVTELEFYLLPEGRPQAEALTVTLLDHTNRIRTLAIDKAP